MLRPGAALLMLVVVLVVLAACDGAPFEPPATATRAPASVTSVPPTTTSVPTATSAPAAKPTITATARGQLAEPVAATALVPPVVVTPPTGTLPYAGQIVSVLVNAGGRKGSLSGPLYEVREEFEQATGARLEIVEVAPDQHFPMLIQDMATGSGEFDVSIAGAWWLGELVASDFVLPYDAFYGDPQFPAWQIEEVLAGPRALLEYDGKRYMVAYDHDALVLYYRRDLLDDPKWQQQFRQERGYALPVPPRTWNDLRDLAQFFDGKRFGPGESVGRGLILPLGSGGPRLFSFLALSAPYVLGPEQPLYWFNPKDMHPLIASPGHQAALEDLIELTRYGPKAMLRWQPGAAEDFFLNGRAALALGWGDLGGLAQQEDTLVRGKLGVAVLPGSMQYTNPLSDTATDLAAPVAVGNRAGGSWGGVISKFSDAPEAAYYLLALLASREKAQVYAWRGWDGVDPGRRFQLLRPAGSAAPTSYRAAGWDLGDAAHYSRAFAETFASEVQLPYLRIPGAYEYGQVLDAELAEALSGRKAPGVALQDVAASWETITNRLGRDAQLRAYRVAQEAP